MIYFKADDFRKDIIMKRQYINRLSMDDVAKQTLVSKATLSRLERGKTPDLITFAKLCDWLGKNMNDYFEYEMTTTEIKIESVKR